MCQTAARFPDQTRAPACDKTNVNGRCFTEPAGKAETATVAPEPMPVTPQRTAITPPSVHLPLSLAATMTNLNSGTTTVAISPAPHVDAEGLHLPPDWTGSFDVLLDGQRVWSFAPERGTLEDHGLRSTSWPKSLRPYLDGFSRVTIRNHLTEDDWFDDEVAFTSRQERIKVVDKSGCPLAADKWGFLVAPFDSKDPAVVDDLLDRTKQVLDVLRERCGLPAYISYGTLLGAVRDGALIGHDTDMDAAYLSAHEHPVDVIRESFRIQRALQQHGWRVGRTSAGFIQVFLKGPDGSTRSLDIFTCFSADGHLYQTSQVRVPLARSVIEPLGSVTLHGREFPAPADPEALLEAMYGAGWRVPDPAFHFETPTEARRRFGGWFEGYRVNRRPWEDFHRRAAAPTASEEPSTFARWVTERAPASTSVVDIGCGHGQDALWFARNGHQVLGLDYAGAALGRARSAGRSGDSTVTFRAFNLYDLRQVLATGTRLARAGEPHVLYARFLVEALKDEGRENLWRLAKLALRGGGALYLEFRTGKDRATRESGGPPRNFTRPDTVADEIRSHGGRIEHRAEGRGLDAYEGTDPHLCRLVARWQQ